MARADETDRHLELEFADGALVTISLKVEDLFPGTVEAAMLQIDDESKAWMVWRPADLLT